MNKKKIQCLSLYQKTLDKNLTLKPYIKTKLENAHFASKSNVCIPNHERLNLNQIKKIINTINDF